MKNRLSSTAVAIALFGVQLSGQSPDGLGLSQAVDLALRTHPLVTASRLGIDGARHRVTEARAERFPGIRVSETISRSNNPVFVFGSLLEQGRFSADNFNLSSLNNPSSLTNFRTSVAATLSLFDGRKTSARVEQARIGNDVALLQHEAAEQQVRFEVLYRYFGLALADAAFAAAEEALRTGEADVERARARADAGLAVQSDLLAAQVQLAEFRQERIQASGRKTVALAALNIAVGTDPGTPRTLTIPLAQRSFDLSDPQELFKRALAQRRDYLQTQSSIEAADQRVVEQRSAYMPQVNTFASVGASGRNPYTGSTDYAFGLGVTLDLLNRTRPAKVAQAEVDKQLAEAERARTSDLIRIEVLDAYHRHRAAEQQAVVAEAALAQAREGLRIIQDRYESGLTTITEMLRSETAVARARTNVVATEHERYLTYARVLLSIGELSDVRAFEP